MTVPNEARQALVSRLRREVARLEGSRPPEDDQALSTGSADLDRLLPGGGLWRGMLVEYLSAAVGGGAGILALTAARAACQGGRALVVVDCQGQFYPPAAAAWGIDLTRMLVLRPSKEADALWAVDQALRCPGVGAVWTRWDRLENRDFRRLQLAAESGRTLALLVRPARHRGQPTWADVQWLVGPVAGKREPGAGACESRVGRPFRAARSVQQGRPTLHSEFSWRLQVELVRCRGSAGGKTVVLELDETTGIWREVPSDAPHSVPVPARMAHPATARRA
jgi:hypothetical protein